MLNTKQASKNQNNKLIFIVKKPKYQLSINRLNSLDVRECQFDKISDQEKQKYYEALRMLGKTAFENFLVRVN